MTSAGAALGGVASNGWTGSGYGSGGVTASWTAGSKTFGLYQASTQYGELATGRINLYDDTNSGLTAAVILKSPVGLAGSYNLTFPGALPAATGIVTVSSTGQLAFGNSLVSPVGNAWLTVNTSGVPSVFPTSAAASGAVSVPTINSSGTMALAQLDNSTIVSSSGTLKVPTGGITATQIASGTITDTQIASATITKDRLVTPATVTTTSSGTYSITGSMGTVTHQSGNFTSVAGHPVLISCLTGYIEMQLDNGVGSASIIEGSVGIQILVNGTIVADWTVGSGGYCLTSESLTYWFPVNFTVPISGFTAGTPISYALQMSYTTTAPGGAIVDAIGVAMSLVEL